MPESKQVRRSEPNRTRRRRTFTMEDESYERLSRYAHAANTNRSRFLEHLLLMAEPILAWEPPPPKRWWQFWQRDPLPFAGVVEPDQRRRLPGRKSGA